MSLSQRALQAVLAQATSETLLKCVTISHTDITTQRLVNDRQDLTRAAGTFTAFPFEVTGPHQSEDRLPQLHIALDNVDQRIITALRSVAGTREDITVVYEEVLRATPDTVETGPVSFRVDRVRNTLTTVSLELSLHSGFLNAAFPAGQFAPSNAG